jgi:beta-glucosidase
MYKRKVGKALLVLLALFVLASAADKNAEIEKKIDEIISKMTLQEKAAMLGGDTTAFDSKPLERLGIPALRMTDGPVGVRWPSDARKKNSTAFPAGICMAATWDPDLVYEAGKSIARETKAHGRNVILAPCVNIHRDPHGGRNFESFGEDPYLAARTAVAYVKGVQSENVVATTKHYVANNQEFERNSIDVRVNDRALREIYLPAFKAAVQEGNTWAIMSSYNRINGHYASSNSQLLMDILKDEWGFQGFVMSDWGAVHSTIPTIYAELDIEMPHGRYMNTEDVVNAVKRNYIKESKVDDKVRRMLRTMMHLGIFEQEIPDGSETRTDRHKEIARKIAEAGIVLLKNEQDILPLDKGIEEIAVIGVAADNMNIGGGGSSQVIPLSYVSPVEAITKKAKGIKVNYSPGMVDKNDLDLVESKYLLTQDGETGLEGQYFNNVEFKGESFTKTDEIIDFHWGSNSPKGVDDDYFSIRWTGQLKAPKTGKYMLGVNSDDGTRLYINGKMIVDNWGKHAMLTQAAEVDLEEGEPVDIRIDYYEDNGNAGVQLLWKNVTKSPEKEALDYARSADVAVVFVGNSHQIETEGKDRDHLKLPEKQVELLQKVAAANENVVAVVNSGAALNMENWIDEVPAILEAWFPGEQGGNAIANVLLGNVNPSGKLATTFMKEYEDAPSSDNYPGTDGVLNYEEGIFVGYRHFDKNDIEPRFPFGHGLSYTTFEYSDLKIQPRRVKKGESVQVTLKVKNTGDMAGAEVVQLYLEDEKSSVVRPEKELKGFDKVYLEPGQEKKVTLKIKPEDMQFWDTCQNDWKSEKGKFTVHIGSSSRDIRLTKSYKLK